MGNRVIDGRFELVERLGGGGMGLVWRAWDQVLHREVALKEVRPPDPALGGHSPAEAAELRARMLREARALARLNHPHVVTVHHIVDTGEESFPWLVMELVSGGSLQDRLSDGPAEAAEAARIGREVLSALCAAHAVGILHRDVKPANVLLQADGRSILTDFGIAALRESSGLTATGAFIGSPEYMAPERIQGHEGDPASDLWSLGMLLYVAVEGRHPLRRATPLATLAAVLNQEVPPPERAGALAPVLSALLNRDPAARPDPETLDRMLAAATQNPSSQADLAQTTRVRLAPHSGPTHPGIYGSPPHPTQPSHHKPAHLQPGTPTHPSSSFPGGVSYSGSPSGGPSYPGPPSPGGASYSGASPSGAPYSGSPTPAYPGSPSPGGAPHSGGASYSGSPSQEGPAYPGVPGSAYPGSVAPEGGSPSYGETAPTGSAGRRGRTTAAIVIGVAAVLVTAVVIWVQQGQRGGAETPAVEWQTDIEPTGETTPTEAAGRSPDRSSDEKPGETGDQAPVDLLTPAGVRRVIAELRPVMGGTRVVDLVVYPSYAIAEAPVKGRETVSDRFTFLGGVASKDGPGGPVRKPIVDLRKYDWDKLPALLRQAERELGVKNPTTRYIIVDAAFHKTGAIRVYVANDYREGGYLAADPTGKVLSKYPAGE